MNTNYSVVVKFQFVGIHCWPEAPLKYATLRERHRHIFHATIIIDVHTDERDIEVCWLADQARTHWAIQKDFDTCSCEALARRIAGWAQYVVGTKGHVRSVEVLEDDENGAIYRV